ELRPVTVRSCCSVIGPWRRRVSTRVDWLSLATSRVVAVRALFAITTASSLRRHRHGAAGTVEAGSHPARPGAHLDSVMVDDHVRPAGLVLVVLVRVPTGPVEADLEVRHLDRHMPIHALVVGVDPDVVHPLLVIAQQPQGTGPVSGGPADPQVE